MIVVILGSIFIAYNCKDDMDTHDLSNKLQLTKANHVLKEESEVTEVVDSSCCYLLELLKSISKMILFSGKGRIRTFIIN